MFYASKDGGQSWSAQSLPVTGFTNGGFTVALDPQRPSTLLVGTQNSGLLVSSDGGGTWTHATDVPSTARVAGLAFDPRHADLAYAATDQGLYRSANGGQSWQHQDLPFTNPEAVAVDPSGLAGVLVGSAGVIARSRDGLTWRTAAMPSQEVVTTFAFDSASPIRMLALTAYGDLLASTDSGDSWQGAPVEKPGGNLISSLAATPRIPPPAH